MKQATLVEPGLKAERLNKIKGDKKYKRVHLLQKIGWFILRPIFRFLIRYEYQVQGNIGDLKSPCLVVSNHVCYIDPLILGTILPPGSGIYPLHFIARDTTLRWPLWGGFLRYWGAFEAHKGEGLAKSLEEPKKILSYGSSVVFFPQAHRRPIFNRDEGRPGAAALALQTGHPILPMAICGMDNFSWWKFFTGQYKVKIKIGQPFLLQEKAREVLGNFNEATKVMMGEIEKLL